MNVVKNRRIQGIIGVGLICGAVLLAGQAASGSARFAGVPARVCVIDLEQVFDNAPQRIGMEERLQARDDEIRQEIEVKKGEIERMKGELELNRPDSEEYQRISRELVQKQADLRYVTERFQQEMEKRVLEARGELLKEIEAVVARVCETDGFDIVLQREFKIPKTPAVWNTAFFVRPEFDITERVVAELSGN